MKRNIVAAALSVVLPGAGQLYNHQWVKGTGFLVPVMVLSALIRRRMLLAQPSVTAMLVAVLLLALAVWSVIDAFRLGKPTS
jgi:TM2 domain-containing membrane protein YozV